MEMPLTILTLAHVGVSLAGILSGLVMVARMIGNRAFGFWPAVFLWTTAATTASGFLFPFRGVTPAVAVGIVSVPLLLAGIVGWRRREVAGWRRTFVITSLVALYLNIFVLIVQLFLKVPPLHDLAPRQSDPPFIAAQLAVLLAFGTASVFAAARDRRSAVM